MSNESTPPSAHPPQAKGPSTSGTSPAAPARSRNRLISRYNSALTTLSQRTGAPLPSLIFSFAVLHEASAVVPLLGIFFLARAGGVGEKVVNSLRDIPTNSSGTGDGGEGWMANKGREWIDQGEKWAERVGRRYGFFGFENGTRSGDDSVPSSRDLSGKMAGDIANAVVAYAATKVRAALYQMC